MPSASGPTRPPLLAIEAQLFHRLYHRGSQQHARLVAEAQHATEEAEDAEMELVFALDRLSFSEQQLQKQRGAGGGPKSEWKLLVECVSDVAWSKHQELREALGKAREKAALAVARLRLLRGLWSLREGELGHSSDKGVISALKQCEDTLLKAGDGEAISALAEDLRTVSHLSVVLPLLLQGAMPDEEASSPAHSVEDLSRQNEALRQELREEVQWHEGCRADLQHAAFVEAEVAKECELEMNSVRLLEEETTELRREVTRLGQELPALAQDTQEVRAQLASERAVVASHQRDIAACIEVTQRLENQLTQLGVPRDALALDSGSKQSLGRQGLEAPARPGPLELELELLRRALAEAYENLAEAHDVPSDQDLDDLRRQCEEAAAENEALRATSVRPEVSLSDRRTAAPPSPRPEERTELIGRLARQRKEIAELKEQLRREELRSGSWRWDEASGHTTSAGGRSISSVPSSGKSSASVLSAHPDHAVAALRYAPALDPLDGPRAERTSRGVHLLPSR